MRFKYSSVSARIAGSLVLPIQAICSFTVAIVNGESVQLVAFALFEESLSANSQNLRRFGFLAACVVQNLSDVGALQRFQRLAALRSRATDIRRQGFQLYSRS